jgi:hypothetical protein
MGHNPRMDLCPKSIRKMKKNGKILRNGFSGKMGENGKKWANGRPAVGGMAEERPAVGRGMVGL